MKDEALKLALEALESERPYLGAMPSKTAKAIEAIKQARSAPVQPVAWPRPEDQPIDNGPDCEDGPDEEGFSGPRPWNSFAQPAPVQEPDESPDDWSDWKVTPPAAQTAVPEGWKLEAVDEWSIRVTKPDGGIWRITKEDGSFHLLCAMLAVQPAQPATEESSATQPAVPDAIIEAGESPEFRDGWNECRETMLQMLKARTT